MTKLIILLLVSVLNMASTCTHRHGDHNGGHHQESGND